MRTFTILVLAVACLAAGAPATAQHRPPEDQPDLEIDAAAKEEAIDATLARLDELYVFPEVAREMAQAIRGRAERGEYDALTSAEGFAALLTEHLQAVSKDKHLRVRYWHRMPQRDPGGPAGNPRVGHDGPAGLARERRALGWNNFGFERVERLPGNVGYIDLREFAPIELARDTAAGAMALIENSQALILDLRANGGGTPEMVQFVCSYFFPEEPRLLNSLYYRPRDHTAEFWTLSELPGRRYLEKPIFVLTSSDTFSAAEECAYNLQTQERAAIIGETTGGGANPGGSFPIGAHFQLFVPMGRAINPITGTNWEGVGVQPDVATKRESALVQAHVLALQAIVPEETDPERHALVERALAEAEAKLAALERK